MRELDVCDAPLTAGSAQTVRSAETARSARAGRATRQAAPVAAPRTGATGRGRGPAGSACPVRSRAAAEGVRSRSAVTPVDGAVRPSAAERAAARWSGGGVVAGADAAGLRAALARHPAGRARAGRRAEGDVPGGAPGGVRVRSRAVVTGSGAEPVLQESQPAVPAPRTVRPMRRPCVVSPRRRSRARATGRTGRALTAVATVLCSATVVLALGLLADVSAGWNAGAESGAGVTVQAGLR
ncbi:hypothetical protein [Pseudonocardia sp. HH130630-07]|uniref:hypothetical protein n=1 Tax=Pseudonocardia sp. HH130630-07 TaxID=1690815 RepID=UPI000814D521|nr:hypothetical protein [Pseudonocardia sp. HH130630-07]ANY08429.1 hypothetical protein AFB00_21560 [Pseudonocardia sp. HH130630-07]